MKRLLVVLLTCLATLLAFAPPAFAGPRTEAAAKDALKKAEDEYLRTEFQKALTRLQKAEHACGEAGCNATTRAALFRDIGVMQFRLGQKDSATASFRRAKKLDPKIALNPSYDAQDLRDAWNEQVAPAAPAGGDFQHTPPKAQAGKTPLPIYVVANAPEVTSVAVKYKNDDMKAFRRVGLKKMGEGWGGYVPCADVVEGNSIHYFVQGFDKDGELVASLGDPQSTFTVPIKDSVDETLALPGQKPPRACGDEELETLGLVEGDRCQEDRQCKSNSCVEGRCKGSAPPTEEDSGPHDYPRFWIGLSGSLDLTITPAQTEVCASGSSFHCTTPEGNDYPGKDDAALVTNRGGSTSSGVNPGGFHVAVTIDYAASANLLVGGRFGYVAGAYPGTQGKTLGSPLHAEARVTYLFGDQPLAHAGIAAYVFGAAGVARFDASTTVLVGEKNVVGDRAVQAWLVAGPVFAGTGGGARYAFSARAAASTGINLTAAIAPGTFAFVAAPEIQFQYGF